VREEAGRTLVSGPLAEAIVATRLLGRLDPASPLLARAIAGEAVLTIALHDSAEQPAQWVAGGAVADAVLARRGDVIILVEPGADREAPANLASTPLAKIDLGTGIVVARGPDAVAEFQAAVEEWKLLIAAALAGLSRQAVTIASAYAAERIQFGQPIGGYQGISHPLADISVEVDAARLSVWGAIRAIADGQANAAASLSLAYWFACTSATRAVRHALHCFGGYGLTLDYDIHLFNLRAKAWPLVLGDPERVLAEGARRLWKGEAAALPEAGAISIDFDYGEEAEALAAETRAFFEANLTDELRAKAHYSYEGHDAGLHRKLGDAGLLFPAWPKEIGGRGVSPYAAHVALRVWAEYGWTSQVQGTTAMIGHVMAKYGSEELLAGPFAEVARGDANCVLGFSEPKTGSDVFGAQTRAVRDGDGWRITGQKIFTSGADCGDYAMMLTRTDPEAPKHKGLTVFILPLAAEGVTIQPIHTFHDERTNTTFYDDVWVPDSYRLGEVGSGVKVMGAAFEIEHGFSFVGLHRAILDRAVALAREAVRDGRPMIEDPLVRQRLAAVAARVQASQMLTHRSLWAGAERLNNPWIGPATKMYSSERYLTDSADLLDLLAPLSLIEKGPAAAVNLAYRQSQVTTTYGGTSEVHRSIIAERQLGLPKSRAL
jgi:alkylation response protein AidB-like acyl-CoA dehydrogenase